MTGAYAYTPDIWLPLAGAIFLTAIGLFCWRRRDVPGALPLLAVSLFGALWLLGIALEAAAVAPATKITWFRFQALWRAPTVTAGLCFVLEYAYPGRWLTRRNLILLSIPVLLDILLVIAGDAQLIWRRIEVGPDGSVTANLAPAGLILTVYGIGLVLVNTAVLLWLFIRSPQHRWPVVIILLGNIASRGLYVVDAARVPWPIPQDPLVVGLLLGATGYAIALFGFHIFDPVPAARTTALEQMQDGMVVFDPQWRIAALNGAAASILGMDAGSARGKRPAEILPGSGDLSAHLANASAEPRETTTYGFEMSLETKAGIRTYEVGVSSLHDFRGLLMGHLIMLHDITEQKRSQAEIIEQQRSLAMMQEREQLARELHDDLGQVLGYVKMQAQAARDQLAQDQDGTADEYLVQLIDVIQHAHADVREYILGAKTMAGSHLEFLPALQDYLTQFSASYGIRTELVAAPALGSDAFEPMVQAQLLRIIQEALTNARKHGRAHCVQVRFERVGTRARVIIQDDGSGFDPGSRSTSEGGHYGLRFMQERAQEVGGSVAVISSPGLGTRVEVEVPLARTGPQTLLGHEDTPSEQPAGSVTR
jgi:PAS domain S-box-containing protein